MAQIFLELRKRQNQNQNTYIFIKHINLYLDTWSCACNIIKQLWKIVGQFSYKTKYTLTMQFIKHTPGIHPQRNEN